MNSNYVPDQTFAAIHELVRSENDKHGAYLLALQAWQALQQRRFTDYIILKSRVAFMMELSPISLALTPMRQFIWLQRQVSEASTGDTPVDFMRTQMEMQALSAEFPDVQKVFSINLPADSINPLPGDTTEWPEELKQFVGIRPTTPRPARRRSNEDEMRLVDRTGLLVGGGLLIPMQKMVNYHFGPWIVAKKYYDGDDITLYVFGIKVWQSETIYGMRRG